MRRKKKSRGKKVLAVIAMIVMVVMTTGFLGIRYYTGLLDYDTGEDYTILDSIVDYDTTDEPDSSQDEIDLLDKELEKYKVDDLISDKNVKNILLIGVDGDSGTNRSDTMILVSINEKTKQIVMTSFLRDLYISIPGKENNRLNASYAYGGASLLIDTLQQNFGVAIDSYATVGFSEFENVVNILGGVDMELTDEEIKHLELDLGGSNTMHLDGAWALRYARIRKIGTDFGRTERQRKLLSAIMTEFKSASVGELNTLLTKILPEVKTDLSEGDLLNMITSWGSYSKYEIVSNTIPVEGSYEYKTIRSMSVLGITDKATNIKSLVQTIYGETDSQ